MKAQIKMLTIGLVMILAMLLVAKAIFPYATSETVTFTVSDTERVTTGGNSQYLVFTNIGTFKNVDCLVKFKFNSSDLQGKLIRGHEYRAEVYGIRKHFLSWYKNIVSVEEL